MSSAAEIGRTALVLIGLSGCIFFVDAEVGGRTCRFAASDDVCGSCVRGDCQELIDSCCGDPACIRSLSDLDRCAQGLDGGCETLSAAVALTSDFGKVAACISSRCASECPGARPAERIRCTTPQVGNGNTCKCQLSTTPTDDEIDCSEAHFPDTICCAPEGWPGAGQQCACIKLGCDPGSTSGAGCFCTLDLSEPTERECSGATCCAVDDICTCGAGDCDERERKVASCKLEHMKCPNGQHEVASCSGP